MTERINYMRVASAAAANKTLEPTGVPGVDRYRVHVPTKILELTTQKFDLARIPLDFQQDEGKDWADGTPKKVVEDLIDYWQDNYSWRREEAKLNAFPQFRTSIVPAEGHDALRVHFIWKKSTRDNAVPLILIHGWPSSPYEFSKVINSLAEPEDESKLAFHVVVPSLPGFGFSDGPAKPGIGVKVFAKMFHELMGKLGYTRYLVHGADWGGCVGRYMCVQQPKAIIAYHSTFFPAPPPSLLKNPITFIKLALGFVTKGKIGLDALEYDMINKMRSFFRDEDAYAQIQGTKPLSLAYGLTDSPIGSLAWIREKLDTWTDNYAWTQDEVLTWWMVHSWLPGPYASMRLYKQSGRFSSDGKELLHATSTVPLGISTHFPVPSFPADWAAPYQPLVWKKLHLKGGHFPAFEVPDSFLSDLHEFFTPIVTKDPELLLKLSEKGKGKATISTTAEADNESEGTAAPAASNSGTAPVPPTGGANALQVPNRPVIPSPQSSGSQAPIIKKDGEGIQVHELAGSPAVSEQSPVGAERTV